MSLNMPKYLYFPRQDSKLLFRYDINKCELTYYDLSNYLKADFYYTGICSIPYNQILIPNICDEIHILSSGLIFNCSAESCSGISAMNRHKNRYSLHYLTGYAYSFGGFSRDSLRSAERFNLNRNIWEVLPDMHQSRIWCSLCSYKHKIFIIGGNYNNTIEIFNTRTFKYTLINLDLSFLGTISTLHLSHIYLVTYRYIMILDISGKVIYKQKIDNEHVYSNSGHEIDDSGRLVYYNPRCNSLEWVDLHTLTHSDLEINFV